MTQTKDDTQLALLKDDIAYDFIDWREKNPWFMARFIELTNMLRNVYGVNPHCIGAMDIKGAVKIGFKPLPNQFGHRPVFTIDPVWVSGDWVIFEGGEYRKVRIPHKYVPEMAYEYNRNYGQWFKEKPGKRRDQGLGI